MKTIQREYALEMAERDYEDALRKAFWGKIRRWFGRRCQDLLSGRETLGQVEIQAYRDLGRQLVPIDDIVGSTGRDEAFDLQFLPRYRESDARWLSIARARYEGIQLPLPKLLKLGDAYLVEDGNHRVSVARAHGQEQIEADVVEIISPSLVEDPSCSRLGYKINDA